MTERLSYEITANTRQADAEIKRLDDRAAGASRGVGQLTASMGRLDKMAPKVARGLSSVGVAAGGMLGPLGGVASFLGPQAGLMLGVAAAATLFSEIKRAMDESRESAGAWRKTMKELSEQVQRTTENALRPSRDAIEDMAREIRFFGMDSRQVRLNLAHDEAEMLRTRLGNVKLAQEDLAHEIEKTEGLYRRALITGNQEVIDKLEMSRAIFDLNAKKIREYGGALKEAEANVFTISESMAKLNEMEAERERQRRAGRGGGDDGPVVYDPTADLERARQQQERAAQERRKREMQEQFREMDERRKEMEKNAEAWRRMEDKMTEASRRAEEERARIAERAMQNRIDDAEAAMMHYGGAVVDVMQSLVDDMVNMEEKAFERNALMAAQNAGNEAISVGLQTLAKSVGNLAVGNLPLAGWQALLGGSLVSAGIGMGATIGHLAKLLPDATGQPPSDGLGGGIGRGGGMFASGGGGGSGNNDVGSTTVNYYYSGGDNRERGARVTADTGALAQRRGLVRPVRL